MATEALVLQESARREAVLPTGLRIVEFPRRRVELAGVLIDQLDLTAAAERIRRFLDSGSAHQVVTVNLDFLSIAQRDQEFRETINQADLAVADGKPLVWVSRLRGQPLPQRVTGHDLVRESCQLAAETGDRVFLLGATPDAAAAAARELEASYPGLHVAGVYSPPFGPLAPAAEERIISMIRAASPGVLLVALGAPRQDKWINTHLHRLDVPVAMGVGCVFDLLAGVVSRAPGWMQRSGLEWAFRLGQEPARLWRRYVINDVPTLGRLALAALREAGAGDDAEDLAHDAVPAEAVVAAPAA